jgi:two-component system, sensor histidine kinase and response regulator
MNINNEAGELHHNMGESYKNESSESGSDSDEPRPLNQMLKNNTNELKQSEDVILEIENNFQTIFEKNTAAIAIFEKDSTISNVNKEFCRISGYPKHDVIGMRWEKFIPPEDHEQLKKSSRKILINKNHEVDNYEFKFLKKNGEIRYAIYSVALLSNKKIIASFIDVTEHKIKDLLINQQNEQLKKLIADKDRFLSILTHDLKNPLSLLLGFSELLKENIRQYDIEEIIIQVDTINRISQNVNNLIDNLLTWVRSQNGKIPFSPQKLQFISICKDTIETFRPQAEAKNISVGSFGPDLMTVCADCNMLKTILRNLLSNAIKFTRDGGKINIIAEQTDSHIVISISDNGIGIKSENLSRLFDISQVYTTPGTANEEGTGLGLLLCKEFVEKHGGKIWVKSEYGIGSVFKFTLPIPHEQPV